MFLLLLAVLTRSTSGVEIGASRDDLIKEKGDPTSAVEGGARSILTFADHSSVVLENGCVVTVKEVPAAKAPTEEPQPQKSASASQIDYKRVALALVVMVIAGRLLFSTFFSSSDDFAKTTRTNLSPTWTYITSGDQYAVLEAKAKMLLWIGFSFAAGVAVYVWSGGSLAPLVELVTKQALLWLAGMLA